MLDLGTGTERGFNDLLGAVKGFKQAKRTALAMREMRGGCDLISPNKSLFSKL